MPTIAINDSISQKNGLAGSGMVVSNLLLNNQVTEKRIPNPRLNVINSASKLLLILLLNPISMWEA